MSCDVRVLGSSVAGVVVALECARLGLAVELVAHELPSFPATSADAEGGWRWFAETFDLEPIVPISSPVDVVIGRSGEPVPVPSESILGIPSSPLSEEVVMAVGQRAASRAYLDRLKPVLTIGKTHRLGDLVDARMGKAVRMIVVEPLVREHFGVPSSDLDVAIAIPGLNEAITRTGSLSTAVLARLPEHAEAEQHYRIAQSAVSSLETVKRLLNYWNVQLRIVPPEENLVSDQAPIARATVSADLAVAAEQSTLLEAVGLREVAMRTRAELVTHEVVPPVIRAVSSVDGVEWSLRVHDTLPGQPTRVTVQSNRVQFDILGMNERDDGDHLVELPALLTDELGCGVKLDALAVEPAPFVTREEVHERNGILAALNESYQHTWVGEWLFGGNQSGAIVHARDAAITVRRHLLGLN